MIDTIPPSQHPLACSMSSIAEGVAAVHMQLCTSGTRLFQCGLFASSQPFWKRITNSCSNRREMKSSGLSILQGIGESMWGCPLGVAIPGQLPFGCFRFQSKHLLSHVFPSPASPQKKMKGKPLEFPQRPANFPTNCLPALFSSCLCNVMQP